MNTRSSARTIGPAFLDMSRGLHEGRSPSLVPFEVLHLDQVHASAPPSGQRVDSVAPIVLPTSIAPEPVGAPARRPPPRVFGYAMAAGFAGALVVGTLTRTPRAPSPAARAPAPAATTPAPVALVRDPVPAVAPTLPSVPVAQPVPAPTGMPRSAPSAAGAARIVVPSRSAAPAVVDTADLPPATPPPAPAAFDRAAARTTISDGARRAASCREAGAGSLVIPVTVTFGPSGRVISARLTGGALVGTTEGRCVAVALRGAQVTPFDGEPVAVSTTVLLQ